MYHFVLSRVLKSVLYLAHSLDHKEYDSVLVASSRCSQIPTLLQIVWLTVSCLLKLISWKLMTVVALLLVRQPFRIKLWQMLAWLIAELFSGFIYWLWGIFVFITVEFLHKQHLGFKVTLTSSMIMRLWYCAFSRTQVRQVLWMPVSVDARGRSLCFHSTTTCLSLSI